MAAKVITVFGATGNQGGSVARTFLTDQALADWRVRAVTRDASRPAVKKLKELGSQIVLADMNDMASLVAAMQGSYAVFAVTNYWEKADMEYEIQQGKNLADAAKAANVKNYIWSSLYNIKELTNGALSHVYHCDSKAIVESYIRSLSIPATFFYAGFYMSNISGIQSSPSEHAGAASFSNPEGLFKLTPDGRWVFSLPVSAKAVLPVYHTEDTGKYIKAAVLREKESLGGRILGATAYMTCEEIVEGFKRVFPKAGRSAEYRVQSEEEFRSELRVAGTPDYVIDEVYENMVLLEDHLTTWEEFARESKGFDGLE
ncbi:NmrA-like family domain-containing protein 1 [Colletotrichum trifolii]|uniref:NmrA-like family domain-containing protein 1 n=1 Tax=Colletotrichum trifolii TaxID=5466 RepID=A0A4R8QJA1_COLTR|nr:NmrA-like family domain-containing protein 1 [Colletotrichum trifolii]